MGYFVGCCEGYRGLIYKSFPGIRACLIGVFYLFYARCQRLFQYPAAVLLRSRNTDLHCIYQRFAVIFAPAQFVKDSGNKRRKSV